MFTLSGDDVWTILRIISLSVSSGAHHGKEAQHITRPPHTVSLPSISASTTSNATSQISNEGSCEFDQESHERLRSRLKMLEIDLVEVTQGFSKVSHVTKDVSVLFKSLEYEANMLQYVCRDILLARDGGNTIFSADQVNASIRGVANVVLKLKSRIPRTGSLRVQSVSDLINHLVKMPTYQEYQGCLALQDFEKNYKSLDKRSQECLFCFSAFPEGSVVDKTILMYWWVGEGLIDPQVNRHEIAEEVANEILRQFLEFHFIEPITKNGKLVGIRMPPVIRYAVAYLAERANFFDFDFEWNPTSDFRLCQRACLMETPDGSSQRQLIEGARLHPEKLRTLFNFNGRMIDIGGKWFREIKNVKILFLRGWDKDPPWKFELKGRKSLKWLKRMKGLRFLGLDGYSTTYSFQGAIGKLENLRILTLGGRGGLYDALPNKKSLQMLTHFEFNEQGSWHLLPKKIGKLTELQVLKGFQINRNLEMAREFATLDDLAGLKNLWKLSIEIWPRNFDGAQDLDALRHITSLRKLKLFWERYSSWSGVRTLTFPPALQKLDLQHFPESEAPDWLTSGSLESLQKLYIRGGNLHELGGENDKWEVKILRLIDLPEFHMDWRRVADEFPDLIYLETNGCPKLPSSPCDANGVWLNREMLTEKVLEELGFSWSFLATYQRPI